MRAISKRKRGLLKIALFLLILLWLLLLSGRFLQYKGTEKLETSYRDIPKNTLDVVFLGPSTSLNGILPLDLWMKYGISSFNASCGSQTIAESYYIIQDFLRRQTPKLIVLECSTIKNTDVILSNAHFHYVSDAFSLFDPLKARMTEDLCGSDGHAGIDNLRFYFPVYEYHRKWSSISEDFFSAENRAISFGSKLAVRCHIIDSDDIVRVEPNEIADLPENSREYLDKIIALCKENGIDLLLYAAPTFRSPEKYEDPSLIYKMYNKLNDLNEIEGVSYLNLNYEFDKIQLNLNEDYSDYVHLNTLGAEKLTDWIGSYIKGHYDIDDHRGEKKYSYYDQAYVKFSEYKRLKRLQTINSIEEYLEEIKRFHNNYVVFISVKDIIGHHITSSMQTSLYELGLSSDLQKNRGWYSYIAVIDDGAVSCERLNGTESQTDEYKYLLNDHQFEIVSSPLHAENVSKIIIDGTDFAINKRGLNIVVYDKEKGEVIDSVALDIHSKTLELYRR